MSKKLVFSMLLWIALIGLTSELLDANFLEKAVLGQDTSVDNTTTTREEPSQNNTDTGTILVAILSGGGIGVIGSIVTTYYNNRHNIEVTKIQMEHAMEMDLRTRRIDVYSELWKLTQPLAKYFRPEELRYKDLSNLSEDLQTWYFQKGGIFMSQITHDVYMSFQDSIASVLQQEKKGSGYDEEKELPDSIFEDIRGKSSKLRTALANELRMREKLQKDKDKIWKGRSEQNKQIE